MIHFESLQSSNLGLQFLTCASRWREDVGLTACVMQSCSMNAGRKETADFTRISRMQNAVEVLTNDCRHV